MLQFTSFGIFLPSSLNEPSFLFPLSNLIKQNHHILINYSSIHKYIHYSIINYSINQSIYKFIHQSLHQTVNQPHSNYPAISPSIYLSIYHHHSIYLSIYPSDNSHSLSLPYRMKQVHVEACHMMHRRWCYRESRRPHCIQHHQPSTRCLRSREGSCSRSLVLASLFGPR